MTCARVKLPPDLDGLLRSEMEHAIFEANLGIDDTRIATLYLIDKVPQIDIAAEYGWERSTISRRIRRIMEKIRYTAKRLA